MTDGRAITLLHLSDPQFGPKHRFSGVGHDTLFGRLRDDFAAMRASHGLIPDLVLITGDLVETGKPSEFRQFREFAGALAAYFGLSRRHIVLIPGNHDISRAASEAYFKRCEADEVTPRPPYWPKLEHYARMFAEFNAGDPGVTFTETEPYSLYEYPDLRVVVAGLNSTIADSHRPEDHYGFLGETQLRHFAGELRTFAEQGWLRIAAVHHNPYPTGNSAHDIRDLADLKRLLRPHLNLVVHGHVHEESLEWLHKSVPVLGIGSAGVDLKQRPLEVPNQYQWIRVHADRLEYGSRAYVPDQKRWIDDLRADAGGRQWWQTESIAFERAAATFAVTPVPAPEAALTRAIASHRAALTRAFRQRILLCDLATYGEDSDISQGLDLLRVFIPQRATQEVPRDDRPRLPSELVEPRGEALELVPASHAPPAPIDTLIAGDQHPWMLILGTPGAGKTTLTRWVALKLAAEGETLGELPLDLVPVHIDLRIFAERRAAALKSGRPYDFFDHLDSLLREQSQHLDRAALQALAAAGRLFWLFDGLDEIADPSARGQIADMILGLRAEHGGRGIVTGRLVGCRPLQPSFHAADIHCFTLLDLEPAQITEFLERWRDLAFPNAPDIAARRHARLLQTLAENPTVRDLCGNPLLLTLIALLNRGDELPRRRHKVLERAAELMLDQWEANKGLPRASVFDLGVKRRYLAELAWHMLTELPGGAGNIIQADALHTFTEQFCQRRLSADLDTAGSTARALIKHLRERNYVLGFLGADAFGFLHKAFFEYFAAEEIHHQFRSHTCDLAAIERLFADHWADSAWQEILVLTCGLLQEDRPEHIVPLVQAAFASAPLISAGWVDHSLPAFAVRCLAEAHNLSTGLPHACALALNDWIAASSPFPSETSRLTRALNSAAERWPSLPEPAGDLVQPPHEALPFLDVLPEKHLAKLADPALLHAVLASMHTAEDEQRLHSIAQRAMWATPRLPWREILQHLADHAQTENIRIDAAIALGDRARLLALREKFPQSSRIRDGLALLDAHERLLKLGKPRRAVVRLDGTRVGTLSELPGGVIRFAYDPAHLARPDAPAVAPTLPLRAEPYDTQGLHPIFANLLPQGWLLDLDLRKYQLSPDDSFGLLLATGRDTIGAIEILAEP